MAAASWRLILRRHESVRVGLLFSPVFVLLAFCMVIPLAVMLLYSFWRMAGFTLERSLSLTNYAYILRQGVYLRLTLKALSYGLVVTAVTIALGFPLAYFMARRVTFRKNLIVTAVIMPLYTSDLIRYFAWRTILGTHGVLNSLLLGLGIIRTPIEAFAFSPFAVIVSLVHVYLPFMILAIWVSLEAIDPTLLEAAMDLGANPWRTFWRVILPLSTPGLVAGVLFVFIPVTGEYFGVNLMGGTGGVTITNVIDEQFSSAFNWPLGSAMSFVLLLCIGAMVTLLLGGVSRTSFARHYIRR